MSKKTGPAPPPAPDPYTVAAAQTGQNVATATANANLNRIDQYTPYGNLTYNVNGFNPDGTPKYSQTQTLSAAEQQKLDQENAITAQLGNFASGEIGNVQGAIAKPFDLSGLPSFVGGINTTGLPDWQRAPNAPTMQGAPSGYGDLTTSVPGYQYATSFNPGGSIQNIVGNTPGSVQNSFDQTGRGVQYSFDPGSPINTQFGDTRLGLTNNVPLAQLQTQIQGAGPINSSFNLGGNISGAIAGAGAITNGFNQGPAVSTTFGNVGAANGDIAKSGTGVQGQLDLSKVTGLYNGNTQSSLNFGQLGNLPTTSDFAAQAQQVQDALYGRQANILDPQFQQQQSDMENRLANMGISRGSEAWNREMSNFQTSKSNAYAAARQDAITGAGTEQSRLFNMALGARQQGANEISTAGNFANAADLQKYNEAFGNRQQTFNEALAGGNFANSAANQQFGQNLAQTQTGLTAQNQNFQQALARGQFGNAAAGQIYGQNLSTAQFANAAQQQQFGENATQTQYNNDAAMQNYTRNLGLAQFGNQAQQQQFGQNAAQAQFFNDAQNSMFNQGVANANLNNNAQAQEYAQLLGRANYGLGAQAQQFGQNFSTAQYANAAQQQDYSQAQGRGIFNNQSQQQQWDQLLAGGTFYNNSQNQGFNQNQAMANFGNNAFANQYQQGLTTAQFANQAQQQGYDQATNNVSINNNAAQSDFANQNQIAGINNGLRTSQYQELANNATMQNAARQQAIQEQSYLRNLPLNELSALMGATGGVQSPTFSGVPQVTMQAPSIDQYMYNSYNGSMNAWQQQQAQRQQALGGIFGSLGSLGSAAISAGMFASDARVKEDVQHIGYLADGTPTYRFRYAGKPQIHFGVMAQEVENIPNAVSEFDGMKMVDYGRVMAHV